MLFAHAVLVGSVRYEPEGESAILVTISQDLNIIVTASTTESARYVDIPLKNVQSVALDQILSTQSQTPMYGLMIALSDQPNDCYFVNAASCNDPMIALAFMSESDAKTVGRIIQHKVLEGRKPTQPSQSEGIDVSEPLSEDELGHDRLTVSKSLMETALRATSFVAQNRSNGASQRLQLDNDDDSQWAETNVSIAMDVIGCEAQEDKAGAATVDDPLAVGAGMRGGVLGNVETSDAGPETSSQLRTGPASTDHKIDAQVEDPDFDSSYDASPMASPIAAKASREPSSVVLQTNPRRSSSALPGESLTTDTAESVRKAPVPKLSKRLQNGDGEFMVNVETALVSSEMRTTIAAEKPSKGKGKIAATTKGRVQKLSKPPKKGAASKGKKKIGADHLDSDHNGEKPSNPTSRPNVAGLTSGAISKALEKKSNTAVGANPKHNSKALPNGIARPTQSATAMPNDLGWLTKPGADGKADDESMWDEGLAPSDENSEEQPRRPARVKGAKKQAAKATKIAQNKKIQGHSKKAQPQRRKAPGQFKQDQVPTKPTAKQKPPPVALSQPRLRREAATLANKRIQHVDESDEIIDDDTEPVTKPKSKLSAAAAPQPLSSDTAERRNIQLITRDEKGSTSLHTEKRDRRTADDISPQRPPEHVPPSTNAQKARGPVQDSYEDASSPENVDLVSEPCGNDHAGGALPAKSVEGPAEEVRRGEQDALAHSAFGDNITTGQYNANDPDQAVIPDSVPHMVVAQATAEEGDVTDALGEHGERHEPVHMVGEMEGSHFQEAMPDTDDGLGSIQDPSDDINPQNEPEITPPIMEETQLQIITDDVRKGVKKNEDDAALGSEKAPASEEATRPSRVREIKPKAEFVTISKSRQPVTGKIHSQLVKHATHDDLPAPAKAVTNHSTSRRSQTGDPFGNALSILEAETKGSDEKLKERNRSHGKPIPKLLKDSPAIVPRATEIVRVTEDPSIKQPKKSVIKMVPEEPKDSSLLEDTPQLPRMKNFEKPAERPTKIATAPTHEQPKLRTVIEIPNDLQGRPEANDDIHFTTNEATLSRRTNGVRKEQQHRLQKANIVVPQLHHVAILDTLTTPYLARRDEAKGILKDQKNQYRHEFPPPKGPETLSTSAKHQQEDPPLLEVVRRAPMISFSASGPRNQGTVSIEKARRPKLSNAMQDHGVEEKVASEKADSKREFAPYLDDPAPWEQYPPAKRQKQDVDTPPTTHKHVPPMLAEPSPDKVHAVSRRVSSQSTRVTESGSPMPIVRSRYESHATLEMHADDYEVNDGFQQACLQQADDDDQAVMQGDRDEPTLSLPQNVSKSTGIVFKSREITSNRKQVPSSPHAPSALSTMPIHHIYHNGEIVNSQTNEPLVPIQPQDPFVGTSQKSLGPFMQALRKSSDMEARSRSDQANKQNTANGVGSKRRSNAFAEDPDKTLVESAPKPKKQKILHPVSSDKSSSSPSSSEDASASSGPSSQESDGDTAAHWRKAYEPHQSNMLEVLFHISHVSVN